MMIRNPPFPKHSYTCLAFAAPKGYRYVSYPEIILSTDGYFNCMNGCITDVQLNQVGKKSSYGGMSCRCGYVRKI